MALARRNENLRDLWLPRVSNIFLSSSQEMHAKEVAGLAALVLCNKTRYSLCVMTNLADTNVVTVSIRAQWSQESENIVSRSIVNVHDRVFSRSKNPARKRS